MKIDPRLEELFSEVRGYDMYEPSHSIWRAAEEALPAIVELIQRCERLEQEVENLGYEIKEIYTRNDL